MNSLKRECSWGSQARTRRRDKGSYWRIVPVIAPWALPCSVTWTRRGEHFILCRAGSEIRLSACSFSNSARHSSYLSFPFGRLHSRSSQTVLDSSVRLRLEKSFVTSTIRSRSVDEKLRPEKSISCICPLRFILCSQNESTGKERVCPAKNAIIFSGAQCRSDRGFQPPKKDSNERTRRRFLKV